MISLKHIWTSLRLAIAKTLRRLANWVSPDNF